MFNFTVSACSAAMDWLLHSFRQQMHKPPVKFPISSFHFSNIHLNSPTSKASCAPMTVNWNFYPEPPLNKLLRSYASITSLRQNAASTISLPQNAASTISLPQNAASTISLPQNDTKDQTSRKVKVLCRFGGKIIANPPNGDLHYFGGQLRIIDFRRDTTFQEFYRKMEDAYCGPIRILYQLPKQTLDTLISVYSDEDFEYMMDEIDHLSKASSYGSNKLRVFLFPPFDLKNHPNRFEVAAFNNRRLSYIKKTNEIFTSKTNDTNNLGNQLDTINTSNQRQQPGVTTCDTYSLFSDNDPWKLLGFQISNLN